MVLFVKIGASEALQTSMGIFKNLTSHSDTGFEENTHVISCYRGQFSTYIVFGGYHLGPPIPGNQLGIFHSPIFACSAPG